MEKLPSVERHETAGVRSYLFCVGFGPLRGIFLKLESTCLKGCFLSPCRSLIAGEVETMADCPCASGRASAWALLSKVDRTSESRKTATANAVE